MSDCEFDRSRRGQRYFTHPLLRVAVDRNVYAKQLRAFSQAVRASLDTSSPVERRRLHALDVLEQSGSLDIPDESMKSLRLEWLREVAHELDDVVLLDTLALAELDEHGVSVSPKYWVASCDELVAGKSAAGIPLVDRKNLSRCPPSSLEAVSRAWRATFETCVRAIREGRLSSLEARECAACLRAIVMLASEFGVTGRDDTAGQKLSWLEGIGAEMWGLLRDRLRELGLATDNCIASEQLQFKLTLHLRALAERERTTASRAPDERTVPVHPSGTCVVVLEDIPPSNDKSDRETLKQYEVLREPLPIAPMPRPAALAEILEALQHEFPWAEQATSFLNDTLTTASLLGVRKLNLPPVLLVGPPGSGKSRLARRFAELCSLPYMPIACGGSGDGKLLSGTSRGWATAEPTPIISLMLRRRTASALVLVDEIDKASATHVNAPTLQSLLLGFLEPETAKRWRDGFLQTQCDLSNVSFWATSNSLRGISRALLSRFEIIYVPGPSSAHLQKLADSITADLEREWELPLGTLPRPCAADWPGKLNAREIRAHVRKVLASWSRETLVASRLH